MKRFYSAVSYSDIFALPLTFNFDDGQVRRNDDGKYEVREHDRAIELQMEHIKRKLRERFMSKFSKKTHEGG